MMENEWRALPGEQQWFYHWILEREKCREGYERKLPKPWSADPILQNFRFCNVRREDDKVSKWIDANWRRPYGGHTNMVLAMVIARTINRPDTLAEIGFPEFGVGEFTAYLERCRQILKARRARGDKVWTGAYLVSTNGHAMDKVDYILDKVWTPVHLHFCPSMEELECLEFFHTGLMQFDGLGSFMAAQVVADLKYTPVLKDATDWQTWAAIGPGSRRGLNRYFGRKLEGAISAPNFLSEIAQLQHAVLQYCQLALHAQDIQNCLCEYDKYVRVKNGEGKPRSTYSGRK